MDQRVAQAGVDAAQIRAARAMLGWSLVELSRAAKVSVSKIHDVERGGGRQSTQEALSSIQQALESNGIRFLSDCQGRRGVNLPIS